MGWNYRVVYHPSGKYKIKEQESDRGEYLAIHEVYYDDDDNPNSMTVDEIVTGDDASLESLKWILTHQLEALEEPILECELKNEKYLKISKEKQNEFSKSDETKKQNSQKDNRTSVGDSGE